MTGKKQALVLKTVCTGLLAALVLASCAQIRQTSTPAFQTLTSTRTSPPHTFTPSLPPSTATRQPATATTSPTPTRPIPGDRPLIAYESSGLSGKRLILLDPAQDASFEFSFPDGAIFAVPFLAGLSPDARYFVYYEGGKVGEYGELTAAPPGFIINILDLNSQEVRFSTSLLSPDFPEVLKPIVEQTEDEYWMVEEDRQARLRNMYETMKRTVLNYLRTAAWSPDVSLLAFGSQNPGPTSDLFFFDPASGEARGVTAEPGHVLDLTWAPDSSAIALETTLYDRHMRRVTTDLLSAGGSILASVEAGYFYSWHGPQNILVHSSVDYGDPGFRLRAVSAADGKSTMLWEGSFDTFALAPDLSSLLFGSSQPTGPENPPGLFLKLSGVEEPLQLSESVFWKVAYWGTERFAFVASAPDKGIFEVQQTGGTFGISDQGDLTRIDDGNWHLLPSPDGRYLAAYGPYDRTRGLRVFGVDGNLLASLSDSKITCLQWNAVSTSLAYQDADRLYIWEEKAGSARLVADQLEEQLPFGDCAFTWVNEIP